ncbi:hypothetical protein ACTHPF_18660 [Paenibacillus sp. SAF-054]|uniref:hypothetical protein n=1 Tax=unclassified Paenibacillus TaxID=185978 RepID=UPI003F7D7207
MTASRKIVDQDVIIETLQREFQCTVLWCEGRACLEYNDKEELNRWAVYVRSRFGKELTDVFFTAVESISVES